MEEKRRTLKGMKGQYELLLPLARDRLSDYFLGLNLAAQGDDRFVVVREVLPEVSGDKERISAFLSELRVTSRFTHPNLLRTLETGRTKISYFAIEEFLLGEGLGRVILGARGAGVEMAPHLAVGLAVQVCDGLEYAHQLRDSKGNPLQAIHRALCPTDIVVGFSGRVKLVDFDVNETAFQLVDGVTRGDLAYLSPEQVERLGLGPPADIFALGTILWELLADRSLFRRGSDLETRQAVLAAQVPPLDRSRGVPGELEAIVARALQRNPRSRFQSAAQLGQALRDWLRQHSKEVGEYEIGVFVRHALGEQEKRKRRLLEQAVQAELGSGDIASLVADRKTRLTFEGPPARPGTRQSTPPPASKNQKPPSLPSLPPAPPPVQELAPAARPVLPKVEPPRIEPPQAGPSRGEQLEEEFFQGETPRGAAQEAVSPAPGAAAPTPQAPPSAPSAAPASPSPPEPPAPLPAPEATQPPVLPAVSPAEAPRSGRTPAEDEKPRIRVRMPGEGGGRQGPPWTAILLGLGGAMLAALVLFLALRDRGGDGAQGGADGGAAAAGQQASLEVRSTPAACVVFLDGRDLGRVTPIDTELVTPSVSHEVAVLCSGFARQVQTFQGAPGERVVLVFRPELTESVDAGVAAAPDAGVAKPEPPKPIPPKPVRPAGGSGFLQVNTLPWTEVWEGNKKLGITPLLGAKLPVGKHVIKLVNPGAGISKTLEVTIQAGKTTSIFKQLQ